jgi:hypothetical protein
MSHSRPRLIRLIIDGLQESATAHGFLFGANVRERDMSARDISDLHVTLHQRAWQHQPGSWHRSRGVDRP